MEKYKEYMNNPDYQFVPYNSEIEGGETAQTPEGEVMTFEGAKHESGGIPTNLPEGTRIYSDKIKLGKRTIASYTTPITKKINSLKGEGEVIDKAKQNSIQLMNKQLDYYFNAQEEIKQQDDMKRSLKMAKGGLIPKYDGGGTTYPVEGEINPMTRMRYTRQDVINAHSQGQHESMIGSETLPSGLNGPYSQDIPSTGNGTPYEFARNGSNNYKRSISTPNGDYFKFNNGMEGKGPLNPNQNFPYQDAQNLDLAGKGPLNPNTQSGPFPPNATSSNPYDEYYMSHDLSDSVTKPAAPPASTPAGSKWDKKFGQIGQVGSEFIGAGIQQGRINNTPAPRKLGNIDLTGRMVGPRYVNYSEPINEANRAYSGAETGISRGIGSTSAGMAFKNKLNQDRMNKVADIYGQQENTNTGIYNTYQGQKNQYQMQQEMANSGIDEKNMENAYNYGLWKTGQSNKVTGDIAGTAGQVFGNMTAHQNQLDYYDAMSKGYGKGLLDRNDLDPNKKRRGGIIKGKRTLNYKKSK